MKTKLNSRFSLASLARMLMKLVKRHLLRMLLLFYYLVQHAPDQEFRNILRATCRLARKELTVKSQSSHIRRHLSPEVTITTPKHCPPHRKGGV